MLKVSIVIANRNDLAMLSVTVCSCLEELKPLGSGSGEVVICDNSDEAIYKRLNGVLPTGYIREGILSIHRQNFPCLFSARETAIKHSRGDYVLCLDSHMIVGRDMILDLVNFMDSKQDDPTLGFAHAPINWAHHHRDRARHDRDMSKHELGPWGATYNHEQTITWKGIPWICRREWFSDRKTGLGGYGALSHHRLSWGGGDLHIGVKPWLLGFKNWAVPTSPGIHIGPFPKIDLDPENSSICKTNAAAANAQDRYRLWSTSGNGPHAIGFLVSCYILGGEPMMLRNKDMIAERFGRFIDTDRYWNEAIEMGKNEKKWLDARKVMTFEQLLKTKPWENGNYVQN